MREGPLRLGIVGATGRLGSRILTASEGCGVPVPFAVHRGSWPEPAGVTVVIDASRGAVLPRTVALCRRDGAALVVCASDLPAEATELLTGLAEEVAVVRAVNLSVGHWLQSHLLRIAGRISHRLPERPLVSVLERHTPAKADRPSATAQALARHWTAATDVPVDDVASYRAGHPVSQHRVDLTLEYEALVLEHEVRDLGAAAFGALLAAKWAHQAPPGLVTISELFDRIFCEPDAHLTPGV